MQKLYYENSYDKSFTAEIINITEKNNEFHIELDNTLFYPEGGGQPCDIGFIESSAVDYVYEENGTIYHVTKQKPIKIHKAKCSINWDRRFDYMQHHLGQHILSASILELFNSNTVSVHMGEAYSTLDIDKLLTLKDMEAAETLANKVVQDNLTIDILYPTKSELKKLALRRVPPKTNEAIRIVKIGDFDLTPCCGIHPNTTLQVQLIKIMKIEKHKTGSRITFMCGKRALTSCILRDKVCN